jgi:uncharacterized protein (UPF0305 family)
MMNRTLVIQKLIEIHTSLRLKKHFDDFTLITSIILLDFYLKKNNYLPSTAGNEDALATVFFNLAAKINEVKTVNYNFLRKFCNNKEQLISKLKILEFNVFKDLIYDKKMFPNVISQIQMYWNAYYSIHNCKDVAVKKEWWYWLLYFITRKQNQFSFTKLNDKTIILASGMLAKRKKLLQMMNCPNFKFHSLEMNNLFNAFVSF